MKEQNSKRNHCTKFVCFIAGIHYLIRKLCHSFCVVSFIMWCMCIGFTILRLFMAKGRHDWYCFPKFPFVIWITFLWWQLIWHCAGWTGECLAVVHFNSLGNSHLCMKDVWTQWFHHTVSIRQGVYCISLSVCLEAVGVVACGLAPLQLLLRGRRERAWITCEYR